MKCPYCSSSQLRVTDKRTSNDSIRRRRECLKCKKRFTTYERIAVPNLMVIKKDGRKEKFDSEKLSRGVFKAFEKSPVPREKIEKMIREIEESIRKKRKMEIESSYIGNLVINKLKKLDNVAYVRFTSVYKSFKNISDFKEVLKEVR